jgi:TPR repeat protein
MYLGGRGTTKDEAKARQMFNRACDASSMFACRALGILALDGGDGTPKDPERAKLYFTRACGMGDSVSCDRLRAAQ